jgi:hypothetical protein
MLGSTTDILLLFAMFRLGMSKLDNLGFVICNCRE